MLNDGLMTENANRGVYGAQILQMSFLSQRLVGIGVVKENDLRKRSYRRGRRYEEVGIEGQVRAVNGVGGRVANISRPISGGTPIRPRLAGTMFSSSLSPSLCTIPPCQWLRHLHFIPRSTSCNIGPRCSTRQHPA